MILTVDAQDLVKGDYIPLINSTVISVTKPRGRRILEGKVEVVLKTGPGLSGLRTAFWDKNKKVRIERSGGS